MLCPERGVHTMKKVISLLLTAIMVLGLFPMLAVRDAHATGETLEATGGTFLYDGLPHYVTAQVKDGVGFTIEYSVDGGKTWTTLAPSLTEVGKLTVNVRAIKGSTLLSHAPVVIEVTNIAPAGSIVTIVAHESNTVAPIRRYADASSDKIGSIAAGETCTLLESGDKWYKIRYGTIEGYVYYWFVTITYIPPSGGGSSDPSTAVLEATGGIFVYDGNVHKVEARVIDGEGFTIEYSTDGGVTWTTNVPSLTEVGKITVKVRATSSDYVLNHEDVILQVISKLPVGTILTIVEYSGRLVAPVRAAASSSANKIGEIAVGETCEYLDKEGHWYKVRYGTLEGYVYEEWIEVGEIDLRPVITMQPVSCKVVKDNNAMFSVSANDADSYQWQYKKAGEDVWNDATVDATYSSYMVLATMALNGYSYRCIVSNEYGSVYSDEALLTVALMADPVITTQPQAATVASGGTVTFHVVATGASTYQWQYSKDGSSWKNCTSTGYNTDTLSFTMAASYSGRKYRCVVSNVSGSVNSNAVPLNLLSKPTITTQPNNVTAADGATVTLKVVATGATKYQWQYNKGGSWKNCTSTGYDKDTFSFTMAASFNGRKYRCVVSNASGAVVSNTVVLALPGSKPTITKQPKDVLATDGAAVTFNVAASSSGLQYQWEWSEDGGATWKNCTITGSNTDTLSFSMVASYNGRKYRCIVSNSAGSVTSAVATLTLYSKPTITTQPADVLAVESAVVSFTVVATGDDLNYQWQWSSDGSNWKNCTAAGYNTDTFSFTMLAKYNGRKYRCVVTNVMGSATSSEASLTLYVKPSITSHPSDVSAAVNETVTFTVAASGLDLTYQWQYSSDGGATWKNCSATGYNTASFSFKMAAKYSGRQYRCIVTNYAGSVTSNASTLTVH